MRAHSRDGDKWHHGELWSGVRVSPEDASGSTLLRPAPLLTVRLLHLPADPRGRRRANRVPGTSERFAFLKAGLDGGE